MSRHLLIAVILTASCSWSPVHAADWPQFMHDAAHTGDAAGEELKMPLGLVAQVKLGDMILTSPAVVGGRVYVVDQMGTCYCVDPVGAKVLWKSSPDGKRARGSNTSSPCVAKGRVYYGTTAGNLHILDAKDGKVIKTLDLGAPILSSPVSANGSVYVHPIDAVIHCLDLDGGEKWSWNHYRRYAPKDIDELVKMQPNHPRPEWLRKMYGRRGLLRKHYSGAELAVSGRKLVTSIGWDHVCIEDTGRDARLVWCNRALVEGSAGCFVTHSSISGGHIYSACPAADWAGFFGRFSLKDGSFTKGEFSNKRWAIFGVPAVRGNVAYVGTHVGGVAAYEFSAKARLECLWKSWGDRGSPESCSPVISSPVLSREHCLFTTMNGELVAVRLGSRGSGLDRLKAFRFKTPHGRIISSSPAVSNGRVHFGCDDGYLYVLGPGGSRTPVEAKLTLQEPRSKVIPATGKRYAWPSPNGNQQNTRYADDPLLKPPFRLRWAARSFGMFHQPLSTTNEDVVSISMAGTVACLEQQTGRIRWRRRLESRGGSDLRGLLCAGGRIYVAQQQQKRFMKKKLSRLYCLRESDGGTDWQVDVGPIAGGLWKTKTPPVLAAGRVALVSVKGDSGGPVVEAWDAATGKPAWKVPLKVKKFGPPPAWCAQGDVMFFSCGGGFPGTDESKEPGETLAIDARGGKVLWRTNKAYTTQYSALMVQGDRLYVLPQPGRMTCLSSKDGSVIWRSESNRLSFQHGPTLGPDFMALKGYGGTTRKYSLDGKSLRTQLGGPEHTCSSAVLTSGGLALVATSGGLYVRNAKTGKLEWLSPGFAPRICTNPAVSNGRLFMNPQVSQTMFCFEPKEAPVRAERK